MEIRPYPSSNFPFHFIYVLVIFQKNIIYNGYLLRLIKMKQFKISKIYTDYFVLDISTCGRSSQICSFQIVLSCQDTMYVS